MPTLSTEQVTTHTLTLTDTELHAVRQAALCAVEHRPDYEHAGIWRTLGTLGQPAKRASLTEQCIDTLMPTTKAQHYVGQPEWCCSRAFETLGKQHADCTRTEP